MPTDDEVLADNAGRAQVLLTAAIGVLVVSVAGTWWFQVPLNFQTSSPALVFPGIFFPISVVFFILWARDAARVRKFGTPILRAEAPKPDGTWTGAIRTVTDLAPQGDYTITLTCFETPSGGTSSSSQTPVLKWKSETMVADSVRSATGIPFVFTLPSVDAYIKRRIHEDYTAWYVEIKAKTDGMDFSAIFTVTGMVRTPPDGRLPWWSLT